MKATEFCNFFEFEIQPISKDAYKKINEGVKGYHSFCWADENADKIYEVNDLQGTFQSRYISKVSDLTECFDSMLDDYIDSNAEEDGFSIDENNTEKCYYEQMLDWMQSREDYKDTGVCEVVACLVHPDMLEDDTEEVKEHAV